MHFWRAFERWHTFYTLTTRRAFIAKRTFGRRKLESWPITPDTPLSFEDAPLADIWFAERVVTGRRGRWTRKVGFERLENGREVMRHLRAVQRGDAAV